MKRYLTLLFLLSICLCSLAQTKLDVNVKTFYLDQTSMTAQAGSQYAATDGNGDLYAIVKVKEADGNAVPTDFSFDFGSIKVLKQEQYDDELWVWVQRNAKTVTIRNSKYKTIDRYDLGQTLQAGKTYVLVLTMDRIEQVVHHDVRKQVLQFVVSPANEHAMVKVKPSNTSHFEVWGEVDASGTKDRLLDFGTYDYEITASDYASSSGRVTLNDAKENHIERITLVPTFGYLEVQGGQESAGAEIYVDDQRVGTIPYRDPSRRWRQGSHVISIINGELYKTYSEEFTIRSGETTVLTPHLVSNFAEITLRLTSDADIYLDGQLKGKGSWTGPLKAGQYTVECRKALHHSQSKVIIVESGKSETFDLPNPIPIVGGLYVTSEPSGATILLDGKAVGTTPQQLTEVPVGKHTLRLTLGKNKSEERALVIEEGKLQEVRLEFEEMKKKEKPAAEPKKKEEKQPTPKEDKATKPKEKTPENSKEPPKEKAPVKGLNQIYIQPTFEAGSLMAVGGNIGGYVRNVNIEAGYLMGLSSADAYWNHPNGSPSRHESLKSSVISARLGYGLSLAKGLHLTPQVGTNLVNVKGDLTKSSAVSATVGLRASYSPIKHLGVALTPEYALPVQKSSIYKSMTDAGIKDFASGFNCKVGITVYF